MTPSTTLTEMAIEKPKNAATVQDVFSAGWEEYRRTHFPTYQQIKVANAIMNCRTSGMGGHIYTCTGCGNEVVMYNSCLNRHCPQCEGKKSYDWVEKTKRESLPVKHAHLSLSLPSDLTWLVLFNQEVIYKAIFTAIGKVLTALGTQHGGKLGCMAILHTWGRKLQYHPHLHAVLPLGVYSDTLERFVEMPLHSLLHSESIETQFKGHFLNAIEKAWKKRQLNIPDDPAFPKDDAAFLKIIGASRMKQWKLYLEEKQDVGELIGYIGKHKHSVAIKNEQIVKIENGYVVYREASYGGGDKKKTARLKVIEFIHRFLMHVLPRRFNKLRMFGLDHPRNKARKEKARAQLIEEGNFPPASTDRQGEGEEECGDCVPGKCPICGGVHYEKKVFESYPNTAGENRNLPWDTGTGTS